MDRANKAGRTAYLRYKGGVLGEEPLDDRSTGDPLAVVIGTMQLPRGVEEAVVGMEVGEARSIEVPPELGYGAYQDKLASWHLTATTSKRGTWSSGPTPTTEDACPLG